MATRAGPAVATNAGLRRLFRELGESTGKYRCLVGRAAFVRVVGHKEFGDINISTLMSVLMIFGLLLASHL